jgi:hypothetical protein
MDGSGRKVGQAASVIGVAVCEHEVSYIRSLEPKPLYLPGGRQPFVELEPGRVDCGLADPLERAGDVLQANARVDERELAAVF